MDFWGIFMFCLLAFLIMSCCGYCCSTKRRGVVLSTPVVVNSVSHTAPGGYPVTQQVGGYPVTQMPPPQQGYPGSNAYPYQGQGGVQMPMPMPMAHSQPPPPGMQQYAAPYPPPQASNASQMNPPSYDAVVGGSSGASAPYEKQNAYNPSFTAQ